MNILIILFISIFLLCFRISFPAFDSLRHACEASDWCENIMGHPKIDFGFIKVLCPKQTYRIEQAFKLKLRI